MKKPMLMASVVLALAVSGCAPATAPLARTVSGVVRMPDGQPVFRARVSLDSGASVYTDRAGFYWMSLPDRGLLFTLRARDGYERGGAYAGFHSGSVEIAATGPSVHADIVLADVTPI